MGDCDPSFVRVVSIPVCDRQTGGETNIPILAITRVKKRSMVQHSSIVKYPLPAKPGSLAEYIKYQVLSSNYQYL